LSNLTQEQLRSLADMRLAYILLNWRDNLDNTNMTVPELATKLREVLENEFGYSPPSEGE